MATSKTPEKPRKIAVRRRSLIQSPRWRPANGRLRTQTTTPGRRPRT
jgi:hypothetical protein